MLLKKIFITIFLLMISSVSGEIMTVRLAAGPVFFKNKTPEIQGFNKLQVPGTPILPAKSIVLALPSGSKIISVNVNCGPSERLENTGLSISPPFLPISHDKKIREHALERWQRNRDYLESCSETFPLKPVYYSKMSFFRNIPYIKITYFPLLYSKHALFHYHFADIAIHYRIEDTDNSIAQWVDEDAARFFSNWDEMRKYYSIDTQEDSFNFVILTKDNFFSAFDSLVTWKNSIGFHAKLSSIDSVIAQYPGTDVADRIRNFLIDKYDSWGIQYLLIGGNVDMIPMKICYPDAGHNYDTPTDYYFAELTDDWDSDGDGFYGEYGEDSIGFIPEVIVGRFPYNDVNTLTSIARKTVYFEMDTDNWKNRALLLGAFSNFENENNNGWPDCDGAVLMETIKDSLLAGWAYTRMYEEEGLCPSVHDHEIGLTLANVVAEWSTGNYAITNWSGHGNSYGAYRKYWAWDDGDSVPEWFEIAGESFIDMDNVQNLDDTHPSIIFAASCSNAEGEENIARALINNGASGIVAATSYGWYIPGWDEPSDGDVMSLDYYFYYYLIAENEKVGDALFDAKVYYFNYLYFPDPWAGDPEWSPQQNMLDYTLFGDPSLVREGVIGVEEGGLHIGELCMLSFHPNPVHAQGYIEYSLPVDGSVSLSLFNILGQKVRILRKGKEKAGIHRLRFNKENMSNGVYFIRLEYESKDSKLIKTQKIIIF